MPQVQCTGADGVIRTFNWTYFPDQLEPQHLFHIETIPPFPMGNAFELAFIDLDPNTVRQTWIGGYGLPEYRAKGIPDAMLPTIKNFLAREVQSSPLQPAGTGTYRTVDAEKMWVRLVAKGLAVHDAALQVYRVL